MASGFTSAGFQRDTLAEIITQWENDLKNAYNNPKFSVEDNENMGQLVKVAAGREFKCWQAQEQCYNGWTANGAEGIFLDEIFSLNGIFREPATAGTGDAVVRTDLRAKNTTSVPIGTIFSGENGAQYAATSSTLISSRVTAFQLKGKDTPLNTYSFTINRIDNGQTHKADFTLAATDKDSILIFLKAIQTFLLEINPDENNIQLDEDGLELYWGFDGSYDLKGLASDVEFITTPSIGDRYSKVEASGITRGFNPLGFGELKSMSILPEGFISVTNIQPFGSGSDVESDAAFVERALNIADSPRSSTRSAVLTGLLTNVTGVEKVKFDKKIVEGKMQLTPVIIGGETEDIAKELYRTQPIDNFYYGSVSYTVATEDGSTEDIKFDRGDSVQMSVRVRYSTVTKVELSNNEKQVALNNLVNLGQRWQLGSKIFNYSLQAAVGEAVDFGRFEALTVEIKRFDEPDTAYSTATFQALPTELPQLVDSNINFVQELIV